MRNWMVLFPEGGFLRKRREISKRYAEKHNLPDLNNVSLPRVGALKAIFSVLPPRSMSGNNNSTTVKPSENGNVQEILHEGEYNLNLYYLFKCIKWKGSPFELKSVFINDGQRTWTWGLVC